MKKHTAEELLERICRGIIACVVRFLFASLAICVVCKCFGWQYKWLYPLAAVLVGMFIRGMFSGVYVEIDKEKL